MAVYPPLVRVVNRYWINSRSVSVQVSEVGSWRARSPATPDTPAVGGVLDGALIGTLISIRSVAGSHCASTPLPTSGADS